MAIEESKIADLIASYEEYEEECRSRSDEAEPPRAALYKTLIADLKELLPRKTLADLVVSNYDELTGTIIEYEGQRGVLLGGEGQVVVLFTFSDKCLTYSSPEVVYPLDEDRLWNEGGAIL